MMIDPIGFFDFVKLEKNAYCVVSDSGTVTEETMIFGVPSLIIRETTERQELLENGSSILTGLSSIDMVAAYNSISELNNNWDIIDDYSYENVSDIVIKMLLGK